MRRYFATTFNCICMLCVDSVFFFVFQSTKLREMVENQTPWAEIATKLFKSERQVKYQWCHLLDSEFGTTRPVTDRRNGKGWSTEVVSF